MAEIEKDKKRSKKKAVTTESSGSESVSSGSSWRDFITSASAALDDLAADVETNTRPEFDSTAESMTEPDPETNPIETSTADVATAVSEEAPKKAKSKKKKRSAVDEIEWSSETKNLDISEGEKLSRFEELARQVAQSVAERGDVLAQEPMSEEPTALGDDSAANLEASEFEAASEQHEVVELTNDGETSFDMMAGEQDESAMAAQTEGEIVPAEENSERNAEPTEQLAFGSEESSDAEEATAEVQASADDVFGELAQYGSAETEEPAPEENAEFITEDTLMSVIESLLFSTDKPVSIATIKQIFKGSNIRTKDITRAIDLLASEFAAPNRGVSLEEVNGGYQLRTKSDNADYLRRLAKVRPFRLSGPALEVMAMVAYKQPITKHEIDEIRGVESGHLLRALMERGLVCFGGKSELPGKPMTYGSTRKFLETFGLRNLKELPTLSEIDELLPEGIGEVEEKETLSDITDSMGTEITSTYSEAEDELSKINESLQQVDTTSEFFEQEKVRERERRDRERAQDIREKLVVGESVEEKDRRWLDRYDAKLLASTEAAMAAPLEGEAAAASENLSPDGEAPFIAAEAEGEESNEISGQLESLTEESASAATAESDDDLDGDAENEDVSWMDEAVDEDDLTGNNDWDEDIEGGKNH